MSLSRARRAELHETMIGQIRQFIAASILFNQRVAEQTGLGLTDMQCVGVLEMLGPTTPGTLAEWTRLSSGGVTVMLDRLEKGGYVKRAPNPADRRSILVSVNAKKLKPLQAYYDGVTRQTLEVFAQTPEAELEAVSRFFARINSMRIDGGLRE
jgi:DNA-binding MarR family transcriptional regulator